MTSTVYAITHQDGQPVAFAGPWESFPWPDKNVPRTLTVMTTMPNAGMSELHDRMYGLDAGQWKARVTNR